jgi:flagellar hook-basal body complex protein FliE
MDATKRATTEEQKVQMCDRISNMLKAAVDKVEAFKQEASASADQVSEGGI